MRKEVAHPRAGLAVLLELERRLHALAGRGEEAGLRIAAGKLLAVTLLEMGLVVERVDLRGRPGHEKPDHCLGTRGEVGSARGKRIAGSSGGGCSRILREHRRQ